MMADQYRFEEYVKPIEVEQLPPQPASTFKAIEGYSHETETERSTEKPEAPQPVEAAASPETEDDQAELGEDARLDD